MSTAAVGGGPPEKRRLIDGWFGGMSANHVENGSRTGDNPTEPGKLASRVARAIEDDILARGWPVGQLVGSEASLMERHGVSRAVLREAIRLVEHRQVAIMRRGPRGGLMVQAPAADPAINAMVIFLEYCGTTVEHLLHARLVLEPLIARLAAERATESDIVVLRAELEHERTQFSLHSDHLDSVEGLHLRLADLAGNPPLRLFVEVLARLTNIYALRPRRTKREIMVAGETVHHAHEAIVEAVVGGDASLAGHRTQQHLRALNEWFRVKKSHPLNERPRHNHLDSVAGTKLAEVTAWNIRADILGDRRDVGAVVGSEAELLDRYDVSRAVLREAIRLLEHHSVARMRRGPGGGLVVTSPDPSASVEAMALYLEHQHVGVPALREARMAVELACVDLVAERVGEAGVADELTAALLLDESAPGSDIGRLSNELHLRLCELSGNPVLSLFERVLMAIWTRHSGEGSRDPLPSVALAVIGAHEGIVGALIEGDASLARRRMTRHLDATTDWWQ